MRAPGSALPAEFLGSVHIITIIDHADCRGGHIGGNDVFVVERAVNPGVIKGLGKLFVAQRSCVAAAVQILTVGAARFYCGKAHLRKYGVPGAPVGTGVLEESGQLRGTDVAGMMIGIAPLERRQA